MDPQRLLELVVLSIGDGVAEVDQQLRQAALGRSVITEDVGESRITQRLRQTLAQCLTSAVVVAESVLVLVR
jgi:hypothetical protein